MDDSCRDDLVWHYTNADGLLGMLQRNVVWAGSAAFMNDFNELVSGSNALMEHAQQNKIPEDENAWLEFLTAMRSLDHIDNFILSASGDGDSLTHWRYYGNAEVSYAIGFCPQTPLVPLDQHPGVSDPHAGPGYYDSPSMIPDVVYDPDTPSISSDPWTPVVYDRTRQAEIVQEAFESFRVNYAARKVSKMALPIQGEDLLDSIKDDGFRDEDEFRVRSKVHNPRWKFVKHRASPLGVVPYVELTSPDVRGRSYAVKASYLPIGAIRVGPTRFAEQARMSVVELLYQNGYRDVEVCVSRIPFR